MSKLCLHPLLLNSLAQVLNQQQDPKTACEVEFSSLQELIDGNKALLPLAICREQSGYGTNFDGVVCSTDDDCRPWPGALRNQKLQRSTNITLDTTEQLYLQCYINQLNGFQIQWLKDIVLPANASNLDAASPEFFALLRAAAILPDCVGFSVFEIATRSRTGTTALPIAFVVSPSCKPSLATTGRKLTMPITAHRALVWVFLVTSARAIAWLTAIPLPRLCNSIKANAWP
jgi:hypothetical protein